MIEIYSDGSYSIKMNQGGWACIILKNGKEVQILSGQSQDSTSNRMELMAIKEGLKYANGDSIKVYTDSAYASNPIIEGWLNRWVEDGWKLKSGKDVKNQDIWKDIYEVIETKEVEFVKVKGHSGIPYNEKADRIARYEMMGVEMVDGHYPGEFITNKEIGRLWSTAHANGFTEEGVRMVLAEYNLVSTKDITDSIYDEIMNKLSSKILSTLYNNRGKTRNRG